MGQQRRLYLAFAALTLAMMTVITMQGCSNGASGPRVTPPASAPRTAASGRACASHQHCDGGYYCTTEDGVCNRAPDCDAGKPCAMVCFGSCAPRRQASAACGEGRRCLVAPTPCEGALCAVSVAPEPERNGERARNEVITPDTAAPRLAGAR